MDKSIFQVLSEGRLAALTESREPKHTDYKEGEVVGIMNSGSWGGSPLRKGTISKINKHGHIHVDHHDHKNSDGTSYTSQFDHSGRQRGTSYSGLYLTKEHHYDKITKDRDERHERHKDISEVHNIIAGHKTGAGDYVPLDKHHAERIHELIKKHTKTD